ncbi:MAG: hypothetical protein KGL26_12210, partial [Pseudomonadota bacterium]|nr:hypothetical protein [Pseudomonadota bacterium]
MVESKPRCSRKAALNWRMSESTAAAAASLGQVHQAVATDGTALACKLQ